MGNANVTVEKERDAWQQLMMTLELVAELSSKPGEDKMVERIRGKLRESISVYTELHEQRRSGKA